MEPQRSNFEKTPKEIPKQEKVSKPIQRPEEKPVVLAETETSPAQWVCMVVGVAFVLVGMAGFVLPNLFGMHLGWTHNLVHIFSGIAALWFGVNNSLLSAERFSYVFGAIYGMLGLAGFLFGSNTSMIPPAMDYDSFWWRLVPGYLELGTADHIVHILIGAAFVIGAWLTARKLDRMAPKGTTWH
ncbi:DUF4383 domain-containing protein [Bdellovibrio bacteriovorus]|uniref:DUF4383 domain-containing protein n=1 Tax=Bdellovibrio bacteriovorus (strain ATCC 15356 / DSM 50701 / NCIMB 9529 / HD100) TaxID=264462 RepID=Q6MR35_BDEBA|nr:DUF4383 domain-containing protein [Bdellovibrio bacteriovorus]AHZ85898.1 hypothetical protein EP01_13270 [Bdellovibrio bacteriovorus]BEV66819.1 hypothetical protein Bb109J_c0239 [Bdellovibrio bacteriovorus]CAE77923.1 hypothetical protein predicted by Glimmer/Critica [Bdellovibrio bacteriovorus HD100]